MMTLYIGGLAADTAAEDLVQRFKTFGDVKEARIIPPKQNNTFRDPAICSCAGFGYIDIEFKQENALQKCLSMVRSQCSTHHNKSMCSAYRSAAPDCMDPFLFQRLLCLIHNQRRCNGNKVQAARLRLKCKMKYFCKRDP